MTITLEKPSGRGNRERRREHSKENGLCYFCARGKGCNFWATRRPRPDGYKCHRRHPA